MATRKRLTTNFTVEEFDCNDGTWVPSDYHRQLARLCNWYLEPMRKKFGPCTVHSGFRTPEWNRHVGGARFSFHVYTDRKPSDGVAADVSFARGSVAQWTRYAKWLRYKNRSGQGGIGRYDQGGFIHIDTRDYKANWLGS